MARLGPRKIWGEAPYLASDSVIRVTNKHPDLLGSLSALSLFEK